MVNREVKLEWMRESQKRGMSIVAVLSTAVRDSTTVTICSSPFTTFYDKCHDFKCIYHQVSYLYTNTSLTMSPGVLPWTLCFLMLPQSLLYYVAAYDAIPRWALISFLVDTKLIRTMLQMGSSRSGDQ